VFVRRGGHVPPLQPLYHGPYTVLWPSLHHFTLQIDNRRRSPSPRAGRNGADRRQSPSRQNVARSQMPGPARDSSDLCWYHASWGKKAKKCRPGCSWQAEN